MPRNGSLHLPVHHIFRVLFSLNSGSSNPKPFVTGRRPTSSIIFPQLHNLHLRHFIIYLYLLPVSISDATSDSATTFGIQHELNAAFGIFRTKHGRQLLVHSAQYLIQHLNDSDLYPQAVEE